MVVQTFRLGNLGRSTDEEVAQAILDRMKRFGDSPDNFLYRGVALGDGDLRRIQQLGTDRTVKGWEEAAQRAAERIVSVSELVGGIDIGPKVAQVLTDPNCVQVVGYNGLAETIENVQLDPRVILDRNVSRGAVLAYHSDGFLPKADKDKGQRRFNGSPADVLRYVFVFEWA